MVTCFSLVEPCKIIRVCSLFSFKLQISADALQIPSFAALEEYLDSRSAATFAASQITTFSNKKEAKGTKRKALPASRGVESLKKVNTSNMAKLTSFFKPKDKK